MYYKLLLATVLSGTVITGYADCLGTYVRDGSIDISAGMPTLFIHGKEKQLNGLSSEQLAQIPRGNVVFHISSGNIKRAKITSAATCAITYKNNGTIDEMSISKARLREVQLNNAALYVVSLEGKQIALSGVNVINATIDNITVTDAKPAEMNSHFGGIVFYQPNYLNVLNETNPPDQVGFTADTEDTHIDHAEAKFQFSFKIPFFESSNRLNSWNFAYTELAFWQVYQRTAFFRENDYQPEFFFEHNYKNTNNNNNNKLHLPLNWRISNFDIGLVSHESNGRGGSDERALDDSYARIVFKHNHWSILLERWFIWSDQNVHKYNPDIESYLGNGQAVIWYQTKNNVVLSFLTRNAVDSTFSRGFEQLDLSVPMLPNGGLKFHLQFTSGYGQSLIEYNHYDNAVGIGISFSDWSQFSPN